MILRVTQLYHGFSIQHKARVVSTEFFLGWGVRQPLLRIFFDGLLGRSEDSHEGHIEKWESDEGQMVRLGV